LPTFLEACSGRIMVLYFKIWVIYSYLSNFNHLFRDIMKIFKISFLIWK
jgi:hypothetical protein